MPLVKYFCTNTECSHTFPLLFKKANQIKNVEVCPKCSGEAKRQLSGSSSQSKIMVDNGRQSRAVEIHPDIARINFERSQKPPNRGD